MSDVSAQINRLVAQFVDQVAALAKEAAMYQVSSGLARMGKGGTSGIPGIPGRGRGRGVKRTQTDLEKIGEKFLAYVVAHPGLRIEQINRALGTVTRDLQLPIRKLIGEGQLKTKGQKRSTQYFPGEVKPRKGRKKKD
jgi:hypothetical protein